MPGPGFEAGNLDDIREFTTCEMFAEVGIEVAGRHVDAQTTDVATLEAKMLDVAGEPARQVASFRFRSPTRKDLEGAARPFDERWHLARPVADSGDRVFAGIQQLD
jgi:predicted lipid-binding transport protein (Tim44 family)